MQHIPQSFQEKNLEAIPVDEGCHIFPCNIITNQTAKICIITDTKSRSVALSNVVWDK